MTGYLHPQYVDSLAEFGTPRELPHCGGWILQRQIPSFPYHDAMGCYPLFVCHDWSQLHVDLENIAEDLVSLSAVTDPFGLYDQFYLHKCFHDVVIPFKEHLIVDLSRPQESFVSSHHRRYARKALRHLDVEICPRPIFLLDEWTKLYDNLTKKHNIKGIPAFSRSSFQKQLTVPGIIAFQALYNEITVGMILWYIQKGVGYYHLGAFSDLGYDLSASFALFWRSIEYFASFDLHWLNLGAGSGANNQNLSGLARFKQGWSTGRRIAYFCGRIFDYKKYSEIVGLKNISTTNYFPAYRKGEFN